MEAGQAYNQDRWVTHLACHSTGFQFTFTHPNKLDTPSIIKFTLNLIPKRYKGTVVFFRTDGERTLGTQFQEELRSRGITLEISAPHTPAQNGYLERFGGILQVKARAIRIGSKLPQSLWPEVVKAAGYILNRTPQERLDWKTPFEVITGNKPKASHLRAYGYKAYPLRYLIPRTHKLAERAHIRYLVGYDSTNIYRI